MHTQRQNTLALRALIFATALIGLAAFQTTSISAAPVASAESVVAARLPLFGHRNWIAIVDSAYPAQTAPGIETIVVGGDQAETVKQVLSALKTARHVRPNIYLDRELASVAEKYAPGIEKYRTDLAATLTGATPITLPHEDIIRKLDEASKTFRVLILKTDAVLPYTSVFIELECGYWSAEAETALRAAMAK